MRKFIEQVIFVPTDAWAEELVCDHCGEVAEVEEPVGGNLILEALDDNWASCETEDTCPRCLELPAFTVH